MSSNVKPDPSTPLRLLVLVAFLTPTALCARSSNYVREDMPIRQGDVLPRIDPRNLSPARQVAGSYLLAQQQGYYPTVAPPSPADRVRDMDSYDEGLRMALSNVRAKQYPQAIAILNALRARGYKTTDLNRLLAQAFEGNHQTPQAFDTLREATVLAPKEEQNYVDLAALCMNHHMYKAGLNVANVGLHYLPENGQLLMERGVLYALQGKLDLAEQDYEQAIKVAPEIADKGYAALALVYLQTGKVPEAIQLLRSRTEKNPNNPDLQFLLGNALLRSGIHREDPNFGEAQAALERSVKLDPHNPSSRLDLARIYLKADRVDDAILQLDRARKLSPKDPAVYARLAAAYRRKGKSQKATAMLERVKELNEEKRQEDMRDFERTRPGGLSQGATTDATPQ